MIGKEFDITRRRVLFTIVVIGLASAAAGAGTMAYFSDTETSADNNVTAGTIDLDTTGNGQFTLANAAPGDATSGTVSTTYSGSLDAEIDVRVSVSEPSETGEPSHSAELNATQFAERVNVTSATATVGASNEELLGRVTAGGDGIVTLDEFVAAGVLDSVTTANATSTDSVSLTLDLEFLSSTGNDAQADGVNITVELVAEQPKAD